MSCHDRRDDGPTVLRRRFRWLDIRDALAAEEEKIDDDNIDVETAIEQCSEHSEESGLEDR